ncbi:MAG: carbohydrate-binding protein, partial [Draconibacterium sp.]|nr:carbohydrate-binding protein [Draconibacterium sp.]
KATVFQDSIVKIKWNNYLHNHDSIIIQRRLSTQQHYSDIATIDADSSLYYDIKPEMNSKYSYRVVAHYNDTSDLYSHPYQLFFPSWEKKTRSAFNDTLMVIPGIIEAEHFDYGGEGLAYHDLTDTNIPGDFRPNENVDIYSRGNDGYHIGNAFAGEWYEYSVVVKFEGWYNVTAYIAAMYGGGTFQIKVDTVKSEIMTALQSWSWLNTKPVSTKMYLYAGNQIMRFSVLSDPLFNIDKISFDRATAAINYNLQKESPFVSYQNNFDELIIRLSSNEPTELINIYSITGSLIYSVVKPEVITTVPSYKTPRGIYVIQSISNDRKYSQKVIIK